MLRFPRARREFVVLLAYLVLALVLTFPLVLQFGTHVAGDGSDDPALTWNLWWVRYSLLNLGASPIYTNYMFYPVGLNLAFFTLTYLNAFISLPIQFTLGTVPAANINLLLSFVLSGYGAYLLVRYLLRGDSAAGVDGAAFAAGLLYAFSSNKFLYASLGQFNIASSQWIPFYLLFLFKVMGAYPPPAAAPTLGAGETKDSGGPRAPRPRGQSAFRARLKDGFLLGLFLLFQALSEFIFASFLILVSLAYLIYCLVRRRAAVLRLPVLASLFIAAATFVIPMSPILAAMISDMQTEGDYIQSGLGFSNIFSADLIGFFIPSHLHPLLGGLEKAFHFPDIYINFVYLGYVALALAAIALVRVPRARSWGAAFALIFLITLGPTLRINGAEYNLPILPFNALLDLPFIKGNRYPSRWSVMLTLCLAAMVGYGVRNLLNGRLRPFSKLLVPLLCLLLVFEHLSIPLPTSDLRVPGIYSTIASDTGPFSVMELPLAWRNGFRVTGSYRSGSQGPIDPIFMLAQWYQSEQQHPILNGNTSRNPEYKFQYFSEAPLLDDLIAIETGHSLTPEQIAKDKQLAPEVLRFLGTRYVVWHQATRPENQDVAARTRAFVEQVLPVSKVGESYENGHGAAVYRVADMSPSPSLTIDANNPIERLYLGEGWAFDNNGSLWAERNDVRLLVPLATGGQSMRLTLRGGAPTGQAAQTGQVYANGNAVGSIRLADCGDCETAMSIPAGALRSGMNQITLHFDRLTRAAGLRQGNYSIPGCCILPVNLIIRSAGEEQGAFGHIYVDGVDQSPNKRGYNLVAINARSGQVDSRANFDTFGSEENSRSMAQFVDMLPGGEIVAVAASDEASYRLTEEAVQAFRSIGASVDLRGKFRWSHAFVGWKGAPAGAAVEQASETGVSQVIIGVGATEPTLAAAIERIELTPQK